MDVGEVSVGLDPLASAQRGLINRRRIDIHRGYAWILFELGLILNTAASHVLIAGGHEVIVYTLYA